MKTTGIAETIAALLREHEVVMIPGLGAFRGTYAPAQVDQLLGEVRPPCLQVEFDEQLATNDGLLVEFLSKTDRISSEMAMANIRGFVGEVWEALNKQETVPFPEIGRLRLNIEGRVQFFPEDSNLLPETFGLPKVRFYPIRIASAVTAQPPAVATGRTVDLSRLSRMRWASLAAAIVVAFAVYVAFGPEIQALIRQSATVKTTETGVNIRPSDDVETPENDIAPAPDRLGAVDNSGEPATCIIAIGLFKDRENVRRVEKRIRDLGFEPFTEQVSDFTRVGVQLTFQQESEVGVALAEVRKRLAPDAFIWKQGGAKRVGN